MIHSNMRRMLRAVLALTFIGVSLSAVMRPAWAANAVVKVEVQAVPGQVSVSRTGLTNYAAVQVTITPEQNNVINQLVFTLTKARALSPDADLKWVGSIEDGACIYDDASKAATCTQGQARAGDVLTYVLIYESPTTGASLKFDWTFTYSQAGSPGSASSSIADSGFVTAGLTETGNDDQKKQLKTFVPSTGGTFFTGFIGNRSADPNDQSVTTLVIPAGLGLKNPALVTEDDGATVGGLTNDTLTTMATLITLTSADLFKNAEGTLTPITVVLQRDEATIRNKTQNAANRVPIWYTSDLGEPWEKKDYPLMNCADIGGAPTTSEAVCVKDRFYVKNNMVGTDKPGGGKYTSADVGDFLFVLLALQNGKTSW